MTWLEELLPPLLYEGRVVFRQGPLGDAPGPGAGRILRTAFESYRLEVAGPPIAFDERIAVAASMLVIRASWALVNHNLGVDALRRWISMPQAPTTPAHHLSADLLFRHLPQVRRRALASGSTDSLPELLEAILRQWPLSGVVSELETGPGSPPDLCGHPGLMLLYAERWAGRRNDAWRPAESLDDYVELVATDRGRDRPVVGTSRTKRHG
jgi:hypothetical protein